MGARYNLVIIRYPKEGITYNILVRRAKPWETLENTWETKVTTVWALEEEVIWRERKCKLEEHTSCRQR